MGPALPAAGTRVPAPEPGAGPVAGSRPHPRPPGGTVESGERPQTDCGVPHRRARPRPSPPWRRRVYSHNLFNREYAERPTMGFKGDIAPDGEIKVSLPFPLGEMAGRFRTKVKHTLSLMQSIVFKMDSSARGSGHPILGQPAIKQNIRAGLNKLGRRCGTPPWRCWMVSWRTPWPSRSSVTRNLTGSSHSCASLSSRRNTSRSGM